MSSNIEIVLVNPIISFGARNEALVALTPVTGIMNYGILSIASYMRRYGIHAEIVDLEQEEDPQSVVRDISSLDPDIIGISCNYFTTYPSAKAIARMIREVVPTVLVVVGGRHAGELAETLLRSEKAVDVVIRGEGELPLRRIVELRALNRTISEFPEVPGVWYRSNGLICGSPQPAELIDLSRDGHWEYALYPNYRKFVPAVEESRGCPFSCIYCHRTGYREKSVTTIAQEVERLQELYDEGLTKMILLNHTFGINKKRALDIATAIRAAGSGVLWTTESRTDTMGRFAENELRQLVQAGLWKFAFGLESASARMLQIMNKTRNPAEWICFHSRLGRELSAMGVHVRTNLMFHAGETPSTIKETCEYIFSQHWAKEIAATPMYLLPGTKIYSEFERYRKEYGADYFDKLEWEELHAYPIHPSSELTHDEAFHVAKAINLLYPNTTPAFTWDEEAT